MFTRIGIKYYYVIEKKNYQLKVINYTVINI